MISMWEENASPVLPNAYSKGLHHLLAMRSGYVNLNPGPLKQGSWYQSHRGVRSK